MASVTRVLGGLGLVAGLCGWATAARADLPPPPGRVRVQYTVRVTGGGPDVALVAHPTYAPGEDSAVERVRADVAMRFVQGYEPGIYSVPADEVAALIGKSGQEVERALAASGKVCVQRVPRVFQVAERTRIIGMTDVFHVEATREGCRATLVRTEYVGANGERGVGGVDAAGRRLPPAPFTGEGLPVVDGLGFSPETPNVGTGAPEKVTPAVPDGAAPRPTEPPPAAPAPAGCAVVGGQGSVGALLLIAGALLVRRRRASVDSRRGG